MQLILTPHYRDLFPGENDNLDDLLKGIPSALMLQFAAMIDAELYSRDEGNKTQLKIFNLLLHNQPSERRLLILNNAVHNWVRPNVHFALFSRHYNLNFIHYILTHYQDIPDRELNVLDELNVFKAYFLIAQEYGQSPMPENERVPIDADFFSKMMWPSLLDNFEIGQRIHPYFNMLRGVVFLNYMHYHSPYRHYVDRFLKHYSKATIFNYVFDVFNILSVNYQSLKVPGKPFAAFALPPSPGFESLYAHFTMDLGQYQEIYNGKKANFAGIKSTPLFRTSENVWVVLNWTYLGQKLYEGLLFDFHATSGITQEKQLRSIADMKRFVGENITERHLFKRLAEATWNRKYEVLLFDDRKSQGFPDTYYRRNKQLFLFEIKDAFFASNVINSFSHSEIKAEIDKKLNNSEKGTGQLVNQLKKMIQKPFEIKPGYKSPNELEVYPVIVYTDLHFQMAGVNEYVSRTFNQMIEEAGVRKNFKKIWPVTMIHIDHLIEHFSLYGKQKNSLDKWIEYYHNQIALRRKKHDRLGELDLHQAIYDVYENVTRPFGKDKLSGPKFIEWTSRVLNLTEGLTTLDFEA